jgi:uroporphyrinogen decarboxylase
MGLPSALQDVQGKVVLGGNLDPTSVFYQGTPKSVKEEALALLRAMEGHANFFLSSGCDLPPGTPLENIEACRLVCQQAAGPAQP